MTQPTYANRCRQISTSTGTGDFTLGDALQTFQQFIPAVSSGALVDYEITPRAGTAAYIANQWEVGTGIAVQDGSFVILQRNTVQAGSSGTSKVNFLAGEKEVSLVLSASRINDYLISSVAGPADEVSTDGGMALWDGVDGRAVKNGPVPGTMAQQNADDVDITGGAIAGLSALSVTGTTTTADGTIAAPSLVIGLSGGGLFKGTAPANSVTPVIGLSVNSANETALQVGYITGAPTAVTLEPSPALTTTSSGRTLFLRGGAAGTTSGAAGTVNIAGGVAVDGNGAGIFISPSAGAGTNRNGGTFQAAAGAATGTGTGGGLNLFGGSSPSGAAGGLDLRTGTGTAVAANIRNRTTGGVVFWAGDVDRFSVQTGSFRPQADNAYSGGEGSFRFTELYAVSGTINTSDIRLKDIDPDAFPDPVALLNAIDPIAYRWIEGRKVVVGKRQVGDQKIGEEQIGEEPTGEFEDVLVIAGVKEDGTPDLKVERRETMRAIMRDVMEPVFEPIYESQPGSRVHLGFSAQQVHGGLGGDQYAMWTLDDPNDPDSRQGLRTDQMIPVLWKIAKISRAEVAELSATVTALLARIEALEAAQ